MGTMSSRFRDPTGERFGLPSYPRGKAPAHLLTRRQLDAAGLRPGGQGVQGQVLWHSRRRGKTGVRAAYLYDVRLAVPKRTTARKPRRRCCGEGAE
uniref:RRQRL motif-containing zinc-binding protein n=1 Tax=Nonomuraea pusilla TaxID=46177 RepID=UPI000A4EC0E0|nr:RRQRL motif-containing zinc-binding protein [Nonomuraea pusilla]